ncbi:lipoyl synthase [Ketobacter alkanivorans]|uniref:Lipoyl synthase n=1 Tax=Ketobacter alkanivorans TaxID=1917421 RepID=A0A2K9LND7_9GAMM|nr:lipoyl synthase [Ketobacter alkanivorans]AUM13876.1 lipoyl synthase [Ketobacter alkanivorans]
MSQHTPTTPDSKPDNPTRKKVVQGEKLRGADKVARIPVKVIPTTDLPRKPDWIRVRVPANGEVQRIKTLLRKQKLHTVCEEASCPNLPECFGGGTATFMIMGDICTRRCPFCDVAHGRPNALDPEEPAHLAESVAALNLKYVVVTSVDRDDLRDGGAGHFGECIRAIRESSPSTKIEVLVPDFRGRMEIALDLMAADPPDVFNHNLENVPRLYKAIRPGSDYQWSLDLLKLYKERMPHVATKSGLMVGLGETDAEVKQVMQDLREHKVDMVTIGQYLQPSKQHAPVDRFVHPDVFEEFRLFGEALGFANVASGPLVRSSYHADLQHKGEDVNAVHKASLKLEPRD